MKLTHLFVFVFIAVAACGQDVIKPPKNYMDKFEAFKKKEKFVEDTSAFYPGIMDPEMLPLLNSKIDSAADDFMLLASKENTTNKEYQNAIDKGLKRFSSLYLNLDTEDRERVCRYFEELMDIVGLESSGGHLNEFMYGSDYIE